MSNDVRVTLVVRLEGEKMEARGSDQKTEDKITQSKALVQSSPVK